MDQDPALSLSTRDGLPEALQVLLAAYPRDGWTRDPGFDGLIQFWLDRHMMFRRLLDEMETLTATLLDHRLDQKRFAAGLSRYGGMFVNGLHEHHTVEDTYYFPKLVQHDPRIARGFEMLDADHHALDAQLASFVTAANAALGPEDRAALQDAAGAFHKELALIGGLINRHLLDEEDLIVPVLLKFGSPEI